MGYYNCERGIKNLIVASQKLNKIVIKSKYQQGQKLKKLHIS